MPSLQDGKTGLGPHGAVCTMREQRSPTSVVKRLWRMRPPHAAPATSLVPRTLPLSAERRSLFSSPLKRGSEPGPAQSFLSTTSGENCRPHFTDKQTEASRDTGRGGSHGQPEARARRTSYEQPWHGATRGHHMPAAGQVAGTATSGNPPPPTTSQGTWAQTHPRSSWEANLTTSAHFFQTRPPSLFQNLSVFGWFPGQA